jgi:hypothetical protein
LPIPPAPANLVDMEKTERQHDVAPVELAAGWLAICATCGWVGETYGSRDKAGADSARHLAESDGEDGDRQPSLAFLGDRRPPRPSSPSADAA